MTDDDIKPTLDMPFDEALKELTGFEVIGIQQHYGAELERLGGIRSMMGAVWAFENRREKTSWRAVEGRTLRQINGYFAQRDPDPESEQGKESAGSEPTPGASPTSA